MQEITKLKVTRQDIRAQYIYFDGCETKPLCQEAADEMIELAADVLIEIYMRQMGVESP